MKLRAAKGGEADIVSLDGDRVVLESTLSSPPGSTFEGSLDDGTPVRVKVRGCRKETERFRIEGRIIDMTRSLREKLSPDSQ